MYKFYKLQILLLYLVGMVFFLLSCSEDEKPVQIIPYPQEMVMGSGQFTLSTDLPVYTNLTGSEKSNMLDYIQQSPLQLTNVQDNPTTKALQLLISETDKKVPEAYNLQITSAGIKIEASTGAGLFYGLQSLLQIVGQYGNQTIPAMTIKDTPYLQHRGIMLDISRHFYPKEFIKKQLDMMAYYKLNRLHWHLVDGTGWRIEIKKYPELTEKAAWRPYESLIEWGEKGRSFCSKDTPGAYGGYYTQEEIKEVIEYASKKYITIIPEIEMPGHNEEVLATFPNLSCAGKPYINTDLCIGNPETFVFLENVLTEVMELFPSEYIHIGGDEAEKKGWETCSKCQGLMKREGMKNVDELQSYMIHRIEKFLNEHGRKLLGWDEIMQGGLAPNATVMSWRGPEYGIEAAQKGHDVIMTPIQCLYFNFYQDAPNAHPLSWAGYTPIEKVYAYNPVPYSLSTEAKKHILGLQANVWTEYIPTEENMEMMIWPRALAVAETGWLQPEKKSYPRFRENALQAVDFLKSKGYHAFDLKNEVGERKAYSDTIVHLAFGKPVVYKQPHTEDYPAGGVTALTDGLQGGWSCDDNRWQGFFGNSMDVVIDLEKEQPVHSIQATFMQDGFGWYWLPKEVKIYASSDNQDFSLLATVKNDIPFIQTGFFLKEFGWTGDIRARYIRYIAAPDKDNPKTGYIFTDEVIVK